MCATRSRQSYGSTHRSDRDHPHPAIQAPHPVPYPFYPPLPYPRCPSYDPYAAYHCLGSFYPTPYYAQHDVVKEESAVWSWSIVVLFILLVIGSLVIVYRSFSRETRRKIAAWLRSPRFTPQVNSASPDFISQLWSRGINSIRSKETLSRNLHRLQLPIQLSYIIPPAVNNDRGGCRLFDI